MRVSMSGVPPKPKIMLPRRGHVFRVRGALLDPVDVKPDAMRPAVVVWVPRTLDSGRIRVVTRTSNPNRRPGVASMPDYRLRLTTEGVWGYDRTVDPYSWQEPDVVFVSTLDPNIVDAICTTFGVPESER